MRRNKLRQHIISLRVSTDEWESMREAMQQLKVRRISDLMRQALGEILIPHTLETATSKGADELV